jgi:hypothetical protein
VCVCVYVYVHVCMYVHMSDLHVFDTTSYTKAEDSSSRKERRPLIFVCMCLYAVNFLHICSVRALLPSHTYIHTYICTRIHTQAPTHPALRLLLYTSAVSGPRYRAIHTYIHTYVHTYTQNAYSPPSATTLVHICSEHTYMHTYTCT